MKLIYVASMGLGPDRDSQWVEAFKMLGVHVIPFETYNPLEVKNIFREKFENRFHFGSKTRNLRRRLVDFVKKEKPDWVHFRLPLEFDLQTIYVIKNLGAYITEYYNDDPFSEKRVFGLHHLFRKSINAYDAHFVYREINVYDFFSAGAKNVYHCPPAYVPWRHNLVEDQKIFDPEEEIDAIFIGHWEDDWRTDCIDALIESGYNVCLRGGLWDKGIKGRPASVLRPVTSVFGSEYNALYKQARAGLCFFSKINRDSWTERPLEIVAVGGLLVCERTAEAERYFKDKEDAFFFSSIEELLSIMHLLKHNPQINEQVRKSSRRRLLSGKHSIIDRANMIINHVTEHRVLKT